MIDVPQDGQTGDWAVERVELHADTVVLRWVGPDEPHPPPMSVAELMFEFSPLGGYVLNDDVGTSYGLTGEVAGAMESVQPCRGYVQFAPGVPAHATKLRILGTGVLELELPV